MIFLFFSKKSQIENHHVSLRLKHLFR